jgi:hypothetical protein
VKEYEMKNLDEQLAAHNRMKVWVAVALLVGLLLLGVALPAFSGLSQETSASRERVAEKVDRFVDEEYGIVCYVGTRMMSCLPLESP